MEDQTDSQIQWFYLWIATPTTQETIQFFFWNIRGINSQDKWNAVREKINESVCQVICIQETKRETFDNFYFRKFCPRALHRFAYSPSIGASSGLLTIWNSSLFDGSVVQSNSYAITVKLFCELDNSAIHVSNNYGPAHSDQKQAFIP